MKTKTLILKAILGLGMVFQGCEKEEIPIKSKYSKVNTENSINKSTDTSYTIIDTLDFSLETEEDLFNAISLLEENQFLMTKREENGNFYVVIAENENGEPNGPPEPNGNLYYCSYSGTRTLSNIGYMICLRGALAYYNAADCPRIGVGDGYISISPGDCGYID
jgi:hypothetical protein